MAVVAIIAAIAAIAVVAVVAVVAVIAIIVKDSANQISKVGILPNAVRTLLSYHLGPAQLPLLPNYVFLGRVFFNVSLALATCS